MKKFLLGLIAAFCLTSCVVYADPPAPPPPAHPSYGCTMVEDDYGEREVCDVYYYTSPYGVVYWDAALGIWVGGGWYYHGGVWVHGYWPGYWAHYHGFYHPHGYFGGYSHHWGGGFHGGYHGGGGFHGGGHGGGHR